VVIRAITNKRFWPSNIDIQNHIALAIKKQQNNNIDQVILTLKLNLGIHDLKTVKTNNNSSSWNGANLQTEKYKMH
jgi:hypothetical protein